VQPFLDFDPVTMWKVKKTRYAKLNIYTHKSMIAEEMARKMENVSEFQPFTPSPFLAHGIVFFFFFF
jgi:hypothetical protein